MSENLKRTIPIINSLLRTKDAKLRRILFNKHKARITRAMREIAFNMLQGRLKVDKRKQRNLKRYKTKLRQLAQGKAVKSVVLAKKGKGIPAIGAALLKWVLPSVIGYFAAKQ